MIWMMKNKIIMILDKNNQQQQHKEIILVDLRKEDYKF